MSALFPHAHGLCADTGSLGDFPFVGTLLEVGEDYVVISGDTNDPTSRMRGTRESRPLVEEAEAMR